MTSRIQQSSNTASRENFFENKNLLEMQLDALYVYKTKINEGDVLSWYQYLGNNKWYPIIFKKGVKQDIFNSKGIMLLPNPDGGAYWHSELAKNWATRITELNEERMIEIKVMLEFMLLAFEKMKKRCKSSENNALVQKIKILFNSGADKKSAETTLANYSDAIKTMKKILVCIDFNI